MSGTVGNLSTAGAYICKKGKLADGQTEGVLVIDDDHPLRRVTKEKITASGHWQIVEETRDHLK